MPEPFPHDEVVAARGIEVRFGAVRALEDADLVVRRGECIGLVGHNGAGKSTIVNVINGGLTPRAGTLSYGGSGQGLGVRAARAHGIRCVFQELSLSPNLTVAENARVMHDGIRGLNWRARASDLVRRTLAEIFPGNALDVGASVDELSIAERQMVEIAIGFAEAGGRAPSLVILDEPTSSLDAGLASQLLAHVRRYVARGGAVILISHILGEILSTATRIVVMKDGRAVAERPAAGFTQRSLVGAMGSVAREAEGAARSTTRASGAEVVLSAHPRRKGGLSFEARRSEIVGLAGLAGHGQTDMLLELYRARTGNWLPGRAKGVAFVAGDRALNGTFALWSILENLSVASLGALAPRSLVDGARERRLGEDWKGRIQIRTPDMENRILSLSGGNQQKVLFARALATSAPCVLMDDPMRGVDVGTKAEVYGILREEAAGGRTFVWYSTEMDEILLCDRVYVFRDGTIAAELSGDRITEHDVLAASFASEGAL